MSPNCDCLRIFSHWFAAISIVPSALSGPARSWLASKTGCRLLAFDLVRFLEKAGSVHMPNGPRDYDH